jgi:hypothetical protein
MESHHWAMLFIIAGVFYLIGARYPMWAQKLGF